MNIESRSGWLLDALLLLVVLRQMHPRLTEDLFGAFARELRRRMTMGKREREGNCKDVQRVAWQKLWRLWDRSMEDHKALKGATFSMKTGLPVVLSFLVQEHVTQEDKSQGFLVISPMARPGTIDYSKWEQLAAELSDEEPRESSGVDPPEMPTGEDQELKNEIKINYWLFLFILFVLFIYCSLLWFVLCVVCPLFAVRSPKK